MLFYSVLRRCPVL